MTGYTGSSDYITTTNAIQPTYHGNSNRDAFVTVLALGGDVRIIKTVSPGPVAPGEAVTYTLVYSNAGDVVRDVTIDDPIPPELTDLDYSHSETGPGPDPVGGSYYTWALPGLLPGEGGIITVTGVLTTGLPAGYVFTNSATIEGQYTPSGSDIASGTSSIQATVANAPPHAVNDSATTLVNTPVTISVLSNDSDPNGDPLTVSAVGAPISGTATINGGMAVVYTCTVAAEGTDTFTYTANDGSLEASATVTVTIGKIGVYLPSILKN